MCGHTEVYKYHGTSKQMLQTNLNEGFGSDREMLKCFDQI